MGHPERGFDDGAGDVDREREGGAHGPADGVLDSQAPQQPPANPRQHEPDPLMIPAAAVPPMIINWTSQL
jgi:hypothetical protein